MAEFTPNRFNILHRRMIMPGKWKAEGSSAIIPEEILSMDNEAIKVYRKALESGSAHVHNIRVMVVGHHGVGKTMLTKRLLDEDVDISQPPDPTNGIEVHCKKCMIINEEWKTTLEGSKRIQNIRCITSALKEYESPQHKPVSEGQLVNKRVASAPKNTDTADPKQRKISTTSKSEEQKMTLEKHSDIIYSRNEEVQEEKMGLAPQKEETGIDDPEGEIRIPQTTPLIERSNSQNKKDGYRQLLEMCNSQYEKERKLDEKDTTYCTVWDFAGHFAFYNTHQIFFSRRSIYLLVSDMSLDPNEKVIRDTCYTDAKAGRQLTGLEFMKFWLNSVHEYCQCSIDKEPPVVLVGTKADKFAEKHTSIKEKDLLRAKYFSQIKKGLSDSEARKHIYGPVFMIDNTFKVFPNNTKELRDLVYKLATKQSYWKEKMPVKWLTLENELIRLKDEKRRVLKRADILDLNMKIAEPLKTEESDESDEPAELEVFLDFHHETGNLLYFRREETLKDHILLDPQWLIDAFKQLISDEIFMADKDIDIFDLWGKFKEDARLTSELIDELWTDDFAQHRDTLLKYMEKLGLIVKPSPKTKWYFAPCVLEKEVLEDKIELKGSKCGIFKCAEYTFTSKLCFTTSTKFIPVAVFNRLLAACIGKWEVYKRKDEYYLFCGCGIFQLEGSHLLYVYFYDNVVQIWIKRNTQNEEAPSIEICLNVKRFVEDFLNSCFYANGKLDKCYKCPAADAKDTEMLKEDNLTNDVVFCKVHEKEVKWKELTYSWTPAQGDTTLARKKKEKKQRSPKDYCMFDGRPIKLEDDDRDHLEKACDLEPFARGGFGDVYKCRSELFDKIPLVVKKIRIGDDINLTASAMRETMGARIRHQFILPLLATFCRNGYCWFISPYCEKGDLASAIQLRPTEMNKACRIRILFQLAKAIEYLHTPVPNVRYNIACSSMLAVQE